MRRHNDSQSSLMTLDRALKSLRRSIRMNSLLRAVSLLIPALVALCLVSFCLDRTFRLSVGARVVTLAVYGSAFAWCAWRWLVRPLTVRLNASTLADLVESRFPDFQDRFRSSLQFLKEKDAENPRVSLQDQRLSSAMKERVADETVAELSKLDVTRVINVPGVVAALTGCLAVIAVAIALWVPLHDTITIWFERQILLADTEWPYKTRLYVEGFSAPDYTRGVPRDDPFVLRVTADGEMPARVRVWLYYGDGERQDERRFVLTKESDNTFVYEEAQVTEPFDFIVDGGDFRSPRHHIVVQERPVVQSLALEVNAPEYTRREPQVYDADIGEIEVPAGSTIGLQGRASKPLRSAALDIDGEALALATPGVDPASFSGSFAPKDSRLVRILLEDQEGVPQDRFFSFRVVVVPDRAPTVRARASGVSTMISNRARIPWRIRADDDYGVVGTGVEYIARSLDAADAADTGGEGVVASDDDSVEVDPHDDTSTSGAATDVAGSDDSDLVTSFEFPPPPNPDRAIQSEPVWDTQELELPPGTRLDVRIVARDNDALGGSKVGRSALQSFLVVTLDRLGAELLRREVEQRRALERAVESERLVRDEIYRLLGEAWTKEGDLEAEVLQQMVALATSQRQLARQLEGVSGALKQIVEEMQNNRVDEANDTERLAENVIEPLGDLAATELPNSVKSLAVVRNATTVAVRLEKGWRLSEDVESIIEELERVLENMRQMEGFAEIVQRLRIILRVHGEATRETTSLYDAMVDSIFEDEPAGSGESGAGSRGSDDRPDGPTGGARGDAGLVPPGASGGE